MDKLASAESKSEAREQMMVEFLTRELSKWAEQNGLGLYPVMRVLGYLAVACAECINLEGSND